MPQQLQNVNKQDFHEPLQIKKKSKRIPTTNCQQKEIQTESSQPTWKKYQEMKQEFLKTTKTKKFKPFKQKIDASAQVWIP